MPRFRTGHRVPLNVYDGDRPIFQAHSTESAAELVALLNVGHHVRNFQTALDIPAQLTNLFGEGWREWSDAEVGAASYVLARLAPLTSRETPVERPESPSESPPATGQRPAIDAGSESRCAWHGKFESCEETPVARWALVDPPPHFGENVGPKIRWYCLAHGEPFEKVGWHRLAERAW